KWSWKAGPPVPDNTKGDQSERERALDETIEETFPASDPPANTVETGTRVGGELPPAPAIADNHQAQRFEIVVDGETACVAYERHPKSLVLVHTEVPAALRGHHLADALAQAAIEAAHAEHLTVVAVCPFVKSYLQRHPALASSR